MNNSISATSFLQNVELDPEIEDLALVNKVGIHLKCVLLLLLLLSFQLVPFS